MIQLLKKFGLVLILAFTTFFSSCEKDLYENQISTYQKNEINNVSINEVPFLIPHLEKYDRKYSFLKNTGISHRSIEDLDLELDKIIEYVETNGLKSYSVAIKSSFENSDDFYFENLHIIKINGDYHPFIARYNATNDSKAFNAATFTGKIELFTVDKKMAASMDLLNGQKLTDPSPPTDFDDPIGGSGSEDPGPPSWMPTWLLEFLGWWNGLDPSSNVSTTNNTPSNGGVFIGIAESGYPVTMGDQPIIPNNNTDGSSGSTNTIAPNEPEWTYPISSFLMKSLIKSRFGDNTNQQVDLWLDNDANNNLIDQVYFYMAEGGNNPEITIFALNMVNSMINNPGVFSSINPFLIEKQINDTNLDPCSKGILNQLKNLQQSDIAKIFAKLDNPSNVYNTTINVENPALPDINHMDEYTHANANWMDDPNNPLVVLPYNYIIRINPFYYNGLSTNPAVKPTKLSIARTVLHELIHVYFDSLFDDCYYNNNCTQIQEFPLLWEAYVKKKTGVSNPTDYQHLTIANSYVLILASALQEYQTGIPVPNNMQPHQDYKDLAWYGLSGDFNPNNPLSTAFDTEYPLGSDKRIRFEKINAAEDSQLTTFYLNISPKSTPCN